MLYYTRNNATIFGIIYFVGHRNVSYIVYNKTLVLFKLKTRKRNLHRNPSISVLLLPTPVRTTASHWAHAGPYHQAFLLIPEAHRTCKLIYYTTHTPTPKQREAWSRPQRPPLQLHPSALHPRCAAAPSPSHTPPARADKAPAVRRLYARIAYTARIYRLQYLRPRAPRWTRGRCPAGAAYDNARVTTRLARHEHAVMRAPGGMYGQRAQQCTHVMRASRAPLRNSLMRDSRQSQIARGQSQVCSLTPRPRLSSFSITSQF